MLYSLPASDFHDIVSGNNFAGDSAGPGYDLATGRGSPIANLLVPDMVSMVEPALAINGGSATFVQAGSPAVLAPNLSLMDTNGALVQSVTITIDNEFDGASEVLLANPLGTNITPTYNGDTLTLTGPDTVADYEQVLRTVAYFDAIEPANTTTRQITFALTDANDSTAQATQSVIIDVAPQVVGALVSGSAWSSSYLSMLDTAGFGNSTAADQGFQLASGADQLTTILPWTNINQISIAFSEPVELSQSSLTLYNSTNTAVPSSGFSYNSAANIATWQFATPLVANKYVMNLAANSVSDTAGAQLDGDWTTGVSTFAAGSGNGSPDSDFNFYFDLLPGDVNNSGTVTNGDVLLTKLQVGAVSNASNYTLDVNGSANVTNSAVLLEKLQVGSNLNTFATPQLPPQSAPAIAPSPADVMPSSDPLTVGSAEAMPASDSASPTQSASVPSSPAVSADSLSSVVILPAVLNVALPFPAALPVDASAMQPGVAPPAADALFQAVSASTSSVASTLAPSDALASVLDSLAQPSSGVAVMPAVGVAGAAAPTASAALSGAGPSSPPGALLMAEVFTANPDARAEEFLATDFAYADLAVRSPRENPHPAFGHLLPEGEG
ncbi:MAG TPA: hypothetical protein VG433_02870, partial [Pirellulales bacterium]|nr:hypothetical protein [Pirellulales bacterium]